MIKEIFVNIKNAYGRELIYPACDISRLLLKLTNKSTFSYSDIDTLTKLNYVVIQKGKTL